MEDAASNDGRVVDGGVGYCATSGGLFTITEDLLTIANVRSGKVIKRLFFADELVSDVSHSVSDKTMESHSVSDALNHYHKPDRGNHALTSGGKIVRKEQSQSTFVHEVLNGSAGSGMNGCCHIDPRDKITSATFGKS